MADGVGMVPAEIHEVMGFHGCDPAHKESILQHGLRPRSHPLLPEDMKSTDEGYFGAGSCGVYLARYIDYCLKYSNGMRPMAPGQEVEVIVFKAVPGREYKATALLGPLQEAVPGYDSHVSPNFHEWWLPRANQSVPTHVLKVRAAAAGDETRLDDGM